MQIYQKKGLTTKRLSGNLFFKMLNGEQQTEESGMNTEQWLKRNGISNDEAEKAGLLPRQISNRLSRAVKTLEKNGLTNTQEYRAFKS